MISNRDQLHEIINRSELSDDEKYELFGLLTFTGDDNLADLIKLFEQDPTWIEKFYRNLQSKYQKVKNQDLEGLQDMLEEEKMMIMQLGDEE